MRESERKDITRRVERGSDRGDTEVRIWPNPAHTSVQLDGLPEGAVIQAFDALGRSVSAPFRSLAGRQTLDVSHLPRGWAVFRITSEDTTTAIRCLLR